MVVVFCTQYKENPALCSEWRCRVEISSDWRELVLQGYWLAVVDRFGGLSPETLTLDPAVHHTLTHQLRCPAPQRRDMNSLLRGIRAVVATVKA